MPRPLNYDEWAEATGKKKLPAPTIMDLVKKSKELASAQQDVASDEAPEQVEEEEALASPLKIEAPRLPAAEAPQDSADKDTFYHAILAAAPLLIGTALGGYQGGALGGQIGAESVGRVLAEKKEKEKIGREESEKKSKLDLEKEKLGIAREGLSVKRAQVGATERLRQSTLSLQQQKFQAGQTKDEENRIKTLQNDFQTKEPVAKKALENIEMASQARQMLLSGKASDANKVRLKIAALFNQGRPSDKDFQAVAGSQALWDRAARYAQEKLSNEATANDVKELGKVIDILENTAKESYNLAADKWSKIGAKRYNRSAAETRGWLVPESVTGSQPLSDEETEAKRQRLIQEIHDHVMKNGADDIDLGD